MIIKILLVLGIVGAVLLALRSFGSATYLAARRLGLVVFGAAGVGAVIFPGAVTRVAHSVGVGRGTDLVLYISIIGSLFAFVGLHQRVHHLEERVVLLTRALALREPPDGPR